MGVGWRFVVTTVAARGCAIQRTLNAPLHEIVEAGMAVLSRMDSMENGSYQAVQRTATERSEGKSSCVVTLHGKVLCLTLDFLEGHPGGADAIRALSGRDITEEFEESGHSESALRLANTFRSDEAPMRRDPSKRRPTKKSTVESVRPVSPLKAAVSSLVDLAVGQKIAKMGLEEQKDFATIVALGLVSVTSAVAAWKLNSAAWH